jgi:hypothetical protein
MNPPAAGTPPDRPQAEERQDEAVPPARGDTVTAQGETQSPKARMPHEHDESSDSQGAENPSARRMGELAHEGVRDGQQDTTKGQELDATYRQVRQGSAPAAPDAPERKPR